jgi:hypothetical protein
MTVTAQEFDPKELASSLFGLEIIVPAQFFDRAINSGEKRLMLAVLEDAVATFQRHIHRESGRSARLFNDVVAWFNCTDGISWPFSFEEVCYALEIDPQYLRGGLEVWKRNRATLWRSGKAHRYRSPFRRVNGRRSSIALRSSGLRETA